jgi:hypothetical protein
MVARWLGKLLRPAVDARPDCARLLGARAGGGRNTVAVRNTDEWVPVVNG